MFWCRKHGDSERLLVNLPNLRVHDGEEILPINIRVDEGPYHDRRTNIDVGNQLPCFPPKGRLYAKLLAAAERRQTQLLRTIERPAVS